ncbi:RNA pyrophosphohydrolase [Thermopetrobacter sp. TC1]|uniref:RNA pyrophosphohydrolase n=1 Tax=Thermopetrobacter sp. TC1 TaxID=1495045 RepID=UPI00056DAAC0|nr:RNA pyrophosphohydrolase [Thermopetrobacter sp. TC1]
MSGRDLPYRPCVGVALFNPEGLVWIGRRADKPNDEGKGLWWQMPQGGIDEGEDPRTAALRELAEETGVKSARIIAEAPDWYTYDLPEHLIGKAWGGRYRGQKQKWYAALLDGPEEEIDISGHGHPPEFDAWRWAPLQELPELIVPFKRGVYEQVVEAFRDVPERIRAGEFKS